LSSFARAPSCLRAARIVCLGAGLLGCAGGLQPPLRYTGPFEPAPMRLDQVEVSSKNLGSDPAVWSELADLAARRLGVSLDEVWLAEGAAVEARIFAALFKETGCAARVLPVEDRARMLGDTPRLSLNVDRNPDTLAGLLIVSQTPLLPAWLFGFHALLQACGEVRVKIQVPGRRSPEVTARARLTYWTTMYRPLDRSLAVQLAEAMALRDAAEQVAAQLCEGVPAVSGFSGL